ncbi:hypothetical protein KCU93_g7973, partial [Aureobasidium melanogenum]
MTIPNLPDPRFDNRVLIYDPEAIKTALSTYFQALSKLPYIEASDIVSPSAAGWPNITATNFAPLGKNETVIALLKHLPYLRNPGLPKGYAIALETFAIDYSAAPFTEPLDGDAAEGLSPDQYEDDEEKIKSWVVPLTMSQDQYSGCWWLLDTTDGTVTEWAHNDSMEPEVDHDDNDPRAWRNACGETRLLGELLTEWREKFEGLDWVASSEKVWDEEMNAENHGQLQRIIRKHGWPHDFRREECKKALLAWDEEHQDDLYGA